LLKVLHYSIMALHNHDLTKETKLWNYRMTHSPFW
jgi:hypothetical protein